MSNDVAYAPLWRRVAAGMYDGIIGAALAMVVTALLLPLNDGLAFTPADWRYQLVLWLIMYGFFVGFWGKCGQTAGMIAWKIKVCNQDGSNLSYSQAGMRFLGLGIVWATMGLGMLSILLTKRRQAVHDLLAKTIVISVT